MGEGQLYTHTHTLTYMDVHTCRHIFRHTYTKTCKYIKKIIYLSIYLAAVPFLGEYSLCILTWFWHSASDCLTWLFFGTIQLGKCHAGKNYYMTTFLSSCLLLWLSIMVSYNYVWQEVHVPWHQVPLPLHPLQLCAMNSNLSAKLFHNVKDLHMWG